MQEFFLERAGATLNSAVNKGLRVKWRNRRVRREILGLRLEPWGLNVPLLQISRQTSERPRAAKTCGMLRIPVVGGQAVLSIISRPGVDSRTVWLAIWTISLADFASAHHARSSGPAFSARFLNANHKRRLVDRACLSEALLVEPVGRKSLARLEIKKID